MCATGHLRQIQRQRNWFTSNLGGIGGNGNNEWYRQHTHPDGIRFEIHEALDRLYTQGYRATRVIIACRYKDLISTYLERSAPWRGAARFAAPRVFMDFPLSLAPIRQKIPAGR